LRALALRILCFPKDSIKFRKAMAPQTEPLFLVVARSWSSHHGSSMTGAGRLSRVAATMFFLTPPPVLKILIT
jgi:hypothetical protein